MGTDRTRARIRALRLLDPRLLEFRYAEGDEADWLGELLVAENAPDKPDLAQDLARQVIRRDGSPLQGFLRLAEELVDLRQGLPICTDQVVWHQIGHEVDTDLLIAARMALRGPPPLRLDALPALAWPSVLAADSFLIEKVLGQDLVDSHVHLGGALPGSFYWVALMSGFTPLERLYDWGLPHELWPPLLQASIEARQWLFHELFQQDFHHHLVLPGGDDDLPPEPFVDYILAWLLPLRKARVPYNPVLGERYLLWAALSRYIRGDHNPALTVYLMTYLRVRGSFIYQMAYHAGYRGLSRFGKTFDRQSFIWRNRRGRSPRALRRERRAALALERFRVRHALRYQFSDPTDAPWARDHGLLSGSVERLRQTAQYPAVNDPSPSLSHRMRWEGELPQYSPWRPPRQLELRVSPLLGHGMPRLLMAWLDGFDDFVDFDCDAPLVRLGLIFHVIRWGDHEAFIQHADWVLDGIVGLLRDVPKLRPFVVGVDVAGPETEAPPRVLAPFLNRAHQLCQTQEPCAGVPPMVLKRTCHAGEDFHDLLTGLRWIDDVVRMARLVPGERIGHGTAFAIEPEAWYKGRGIVHKRRREHLVDLLWCRHIACLSDGRLHLQRDLALDQLAEDLIRESFTDLVRADTAHRVHEHYLDLVRFPSEADLLDGFGLADPEEWMDYYPAPRFVDLVVRTRARVRRILCMKEIILEVCPTSNMLIGKFGCYEALPYLNLNRLGLPPSSKEVHAEIQEYPVLFTINSDDPGNFKTTIANEYRLLGHALQAQGFHAAHVYDWLDKLRTTSLAGSFIPDWSPPTKLELLYLFDHLFDPSPR